MIASRTVTKEASDDTRAKRMKNKVDQSNQKSTRFDRDFVRKQGKLLEAKMEQHFNESWSFANNHLCCLNKVNLENLLKQICFNPSSKM